MIRLLVERSNYGNELAWLYETDLWPDFYSAVLQLGTGERMVSCLVG
jgi:hypothetical protein